MMIINSRHIYLTIVENESAVIIFIHSPKATLKEVQKHANGPIILD